ncbi:hypothetical protein GGR52DRAFT_456257 [Hypoxylon sp. FL1284]|nr:hypothetical protein GGR52DRAFT_456257 [Hypoxylon sp. FL1284]
MGTGTVHGSTAVRMKIGLCLAFAVWIPCGGSVDDAPGLFTTEAITNSTGQCCQHLPTAQPTTEKLFSLSTSRCSAWLGNQKGDVFSIGFRAAGFNIIMVVTLFLF